MVVQRILIAATIIAACAGCASRPTATEGLPRQSQPEKSACLSSSPGDASTIPQQESGLSSAPQCEEAVATPGQVEETVPIEPDVADRPMPPLPRGKTWKLIWSEEFDGQNLDLTKWTIRTGPRRDGFWSEEAVSLDGKGRLIIKTYEEQGKYFSGAIQTKDKFEFTYGYVEARCRLPTEEGHWAAFWLQSPTLNRRSNGPESGAEIDIFEYHARWGNELMHAIHWDGYRKAMSQRTEISGLADGFHTFGLEWAAGGYVFYVDARPVWRTTKGVTNGREYIVLSEEIGKWAGQIEKAKLPDYFEVDYVRVYQSAQTESEQQTQ